MTNWMQQLQETYSHIVHSRLLNEGQSLNVGAPGSKTSLNHDMELPYFHQHPASKSYPWGFADESPMIYRVLNTGLPGEHERMPGGSIIPYDPNKESREDFLKRMGDMAQANRVRASEAQSEIDEIDRDTKTAVGAALLPVALYANPYVEKAVNFLTALKLSKELNNSKNPGDKVEIPDDLPVKGPADDLPVKGPADNYPLPKPDYPVKGPADNYPLPKPDYPVKAESWLRDLSNKYVQMIRHRLLSEGGSLNVGTPGQMGEPMQPAMRPMRPGDDPHQRLAAGREQLAKDWQEAHDEDRNLWLQQIGAVASPAVAALAGLAALPEAGIAAMTAIDADIAAMEAGTGMVTGAVPAIWGSKDDTADLRSGKIPYTYSPNNPFVHQYVDLNGQPKTSQATPAKPTPKSNQQYYEPTRNPNPYGDWDPNLKETYTQMIRRRLLSELASKGSLFDNKDNPIRLSKYIRAPKDMAHAQTDLSTIDELESGHYSLKPGAFYVNDPSIPSGILASDSMKNLDKMYNDEIDFLRKHR